MSEIGSPAALGRAAGPDTVRRHGTPGPAGEAFEALLRKVGREVRALQQGTRTLAAGESRAESLEALLAEADRNYAAAREAQKTLLRAYRALHPRGTAPSRARPAP